MTGPRSLRSRLFVLIVVPLAVVALLSSLVLHLMARNMSRDLYDDTLVVVAHAVAREAVLSEGNILPAALLESLQGAIGGPIYYQVVAMGGLFVAGFSDPPPVPEDRALQPGTPVHYDATYRGQPVRVVALREYILDPERDGPTTVRVWQTTQRRQELSRTLLAQSAGVLVLLVASAAALVWFGIDRGLAPLMRLRDALALRTPDDLHPIRRKVPTEAVPLVDTINDLFLRLSDELERRNAFISNAAHQLRNPVAGIQAQAEAALSAQHEKDRRQRLTDLMVAARRLSRMSQQLLRLDAIRDGADGPDAAEPVDFGQVVADVARRHVPRALRHGIDVELNEAAEPLPVRLNTVLLEEAVDNVIDNALRYGCPPGGSLRLRLDREGDEAVLRVADQGPGIPPDQAERVFERFFRLAGRDDGGSGLGLPIVRAIAVAAGGRAAIEPSAAGCTVLIALPLAA